MVGLGSERVICKVRVLDARRLNYISLESLGTDEVASQK